MGRVRLKYVFLCFSSIKKTLVLANVVSSVFLISTFDHDLVKNLTTRTLRSVHKNGNF